MTLAGKISIEVGIHATAEKWFNLASAQLHQVQHLAERVHGAKLHQGEDWHHNESIKHWTYVLDGKVTKCLESIESVDKENKTVTYKVFGEDIDPSFKVFKFIVQATDKEQGGATVKWTIEYERVSEEVDPPYGYMELFHKSTRDMDAHLVKA